MRRTEQFDLFANSLLPSELSPQSKERFAQRARYAKITPNGPPFSEESGDQIVFLASGSAKLVAQASQGREQIIAFYFINDLVSVPTSFAHIYALFALEDCDLVYFSEADFFDAASQEAGAIYAVVQRTLRSLGRCHEKTIVLGRKNAQEKVASFLLGMAERIGENEAARCELTLPMSRKEIADNLGMTIETVSRQFSELKELGMVETVGRSDVRLLDMAGLNTCAGHVQRSAN